MRHNKYDYDAFISHAVEDKIPIANELCAKLEAAGLKIWYSGKELGVGDSIEKTIQNGLNRCLGKAAGQSQMRVLHICTADADGVKTTG